MSRDLYGIRASEISERQFKNKGLLASVSAEKTYALEFTCSFQESFTGNLIMGSAYFIISTGTFVADTNNNASKIALKELISCFKKTSDIEELFEGYEWEAPIDTNYNFISQQALKIAEEIESDIFISDYIEPLPLQSEKKEEPPLQTKKEYADPVVKKNDPVFLECLKALITELINTSLPDELKELSPNLTEKLAEPLGKNIQMILSDDATESEKTTAKDAIKSSVKSAAHDAITNTPNMNQVKKLAAHGMVEVITRNFVNKIFNLHKEKKLIPLLKQHIHDALTTVPTIAKKMQRGTSPAKAVHESVIEAHAAQQKAAPSYWESFKSRMFKTVVDKVAAVTSQDKKPPLPSSNSKIPTK